LITILYINFLAPDKISNSDLIHKILLSVDKLDVQTLYKIYYTLEPRLSLPKHYDRGEYIRYMYIDDITGDPKRGNIRVYPETPMYVIINHIGERLGYAFPEWSKKIAMEQAHFKNAFYISKITDDDVERMLNTRADKFSMLDPYISNMYNFFIAAGQSNGYNEGGIYIKGDDD